MRTGRIQLTIFRKIEAINKGSLIVFVLFLELLISLGDYYSSPLAPFTHLYLLPILIAAFFLDPGWSYFFSLMAAMGGIPAFNGLLDIFDLTAVSLNFLSEAVIFFTVAFLSTQLRKLLDGVNKHASEDFLTKAHSRWNFYELCSLELSRSYRYKHPISLAYIDLDIFKQVNDSRGHEEGDKLLVKAANSIKTDLRYNDVLGRLGGDEFGVLLVETDQKEGEIIIGRMKENLLKAMVNLETNVTVSIGVVTYLAENKPVLMNY